MQLRQLHGETACERDAVRHIHRSWLPGLQNRILRAAENLTSYVPRLLLKFLLRDSPYRGRFSVAR